MAKQYEFVDFPISQLEFINSTAGKLRIEALVEALNQDVVNSVQFINIIQMILQKKHSPENIRIRLMIMGSQQVNDNRYDPTGPLFLVVTLVLQHDGSEFNMLYSRGGDVPSIPEMHEKFARLFDWSKEITFGTVNARLVPLIEQVGKSRGGNTDANPNWTMYLPRNKWSSITRNSPPGIKCQKLSKEHASIVNDHWKFKDATSILIFQDQIQYFISAGTFVDNSNAALDDTPSSGTRPTDDSSELVSWIASMPIGTLNALQTPEKHRRKGYAELTMREASRQAIEMDIYPLCEVELHSIESKAMLEKIGFELAFDACWVIYKPDGAGSL